MKASLILLCSLTLLCQFSATRSPAQQSNPFDDLLDGKREGLFVGGGIAYGANRFTISTIDGVVYDYEREEAAELGGISGRLQWKLGYATSENLAFYATSFGTNFAPSLGIMMFSQQYPGYYLNALVGYSSSEATRSSFVDEAENYNTWNIGAGIGYEFRKHFMAEFTVGYSRFKISTWDASAYLERVTLFASFNYLLY